MTVWGDGASPLRCQFFRFCVMWAETHHPIYPYLLWIYAVATGPFTLAVARDPNTHNGVVPALGACVGVILVLLLALLIGLQGGMK